MVASIKEIFVCTFCGSVVSSNQKPEVCSKCKNKFNVEDCGKFEYFWPKGPMELKEQYMKIKTEEALNSADRDRKKNPEKDNSPQSHEIRSKILNTENDRFLTFLQKTTVSDINTLLESLSYLCIMAPHSSSEALIKRLVFFYKQLERPMAVLEAMLQAGTAGKINLEKILRK
jgi:hypothetical protein